MFYTILYWRPLLIMKRTGANLFKAWVIANTLVKIYFQDKLVSKSLVSFEKKLMIVSLGKLIDLGLILGLRNYLKSLEVISTIQRSVSNIY